MTKSERPYALTGSTQRMNTPRGKIYVTINNDSAGRPFEVILNGGSSGGSRNSEIEGLGKTMSNALRSGSDPEELANDLQGISGPRHAVDNGDYIRSIQDAVGIAMLRHIKGKYGEPIRGGALDD